jgi:hypothetical protein
MQKKYYVNALEEKNYSKSPLGDLGVEKRWFKERK